MKIKTTIAATALVITFSASAWAAEETRDPVLHEPVALSEAQMDGVTAGIGGCHHACRLVDDRIYHLLHDIVDDIEHFLQRQGIHVQLHRHHDGTVKFFPHVDLRDQRIWDSRQL